MGRPKSSFGFFHMLLQKSQNKLLGQPNRYRSQLAPHPTPLPSSQGSFHPVPSWVRPGQRLSSAVCSSPPSWILLHRSSDINAHCFCAYLLLTGAHPFQLWTIPVSPVSSITCMPPFSKPTQPQELSLTTPLCG